MLSFLLSEAICVENVVGILLEIACFNVDPVLEERQIHSDIPLRADGLVESFIENLSTFNDALHFHSWNKIGEHLIWNEGFTSGTSPAASELQRVHNTLCRKESLGKVHPSRAGRGEVE